MAPYGATNLSADPAIYTGTHNGRRLLVRVYPDGFTTLTTTLRAHEDWAPEAELTAVSLADVAGAVTA